MSGFLDALAGAPGISVDDLLGGRALVVLSPHPDDETLGCGALLHDASSQGMPCHVVCVTDGSRSHPNSIQWPAPRLAQQRRAELEAAMQILAPAARLHWLGHADCAVPEDADTAAAIAALIPQGALVLASWALDPHCDHLSVARLAQAVGAIRPDIALRFYPIWGRFTDHAAPARLLRSSDAARRAKAAALACHRSQMSALIEDDPQGFVMEDWRQRHFLEHPEIVLAQP